MKRLCMICFVVLFAVCSLVHAEEGWQTYRADDYGFSMQVPEGTSFVEKEKSGGWGGLYAVSEGVKFYGLAKLGSYAEPEEIHKFGVKESGIAAKYWTKIEEGKDSNGWKWYQTFKATDGNILVFAGLGTGPKGSYLLFLKTTKKDFEENTEDYNDWYESITLF